MLAQIAQSIKMPFNERDKQIMEIITENYLKDLATQTDHRSTVLLDVLISYITEVSDYDRAFRYRVREANITNPRISRLDELLSLQGFSQEQHPFLTEISPQYPRLHWAVEIARICAEKYCELHPEDYTLLVL